MATWRDSCYGRRSITSASRVFRWPFHFLRFASNGAALSRNNWRKLHYISMDDGRNASLARAAQPQRRALAHARTALKRVTALSPLRPRATTARHAPGLRGIHALPHRPNPARTVNVAMACGIPCTTLPLYLSPLPAPGEGCAAAAPHSRAAGPYAHSLKIIEVTLEHLGLAALAFDSSIERAQDARHARRGA